MCDINNDLQLAVYGYARENTDKYFPSDLIDIILNSYLKDYDFCNEHFIYKNYKIHIKCEKLLNNISTKAYLNIWLLVGNNCNEYGNYIYIFSKAKCKCNKYITYCYRENMN